MDTEIAVNFAIHGKAHDFGEVMETILHKKVKNVIEARKMKIAEDILGEGKEIFCVISVSGGGGNSQATISKCFKNAKAASKHADEMNAHPNNKGKYVFGVVSSKVEELESDAGSILDEDGYASLNLPDEEMTKNLIESGDKCFVVTSANEREKNVGIHGIYMDEEMAHCRIEGLEDRNESGLTYEVSETTVQSFIRFGEGVEGLFGEDAYSVDEGKGVPPECMDCFAVHVKGITLPDDEIILKKVFKKKADANRAAKEQRDRFKNPRRLGYPNKYKVTVLKMDSKEFKAVSKDFDLSGDWDIVECAETEGTFLVDDWCNDVAESGRGLGHGKDWKTKKKMRIANNTDTGSSTLAKNDTRLRKFISLKIKNKKKLDRDYIHDIDKKFLEKEEWEFEDMVDAVNAITHSEEIDYDLLDIVMEFKMPEKGKGDDDNNVNLAMKFLKAFENKHIEENPISKAVKFIEDMEKGLSGNPKIKKEIARLTKLKKDM